jgi:hypothetical protein
MIVPKRPSVPEVRAEDAADDGADEEHIRYTGKVNFADF